MIQNIQVRKLQEGDMDLFVELISIFEEVFAMRNFVLPPGEHLQQLLADKDFFVFVALDGANNLVGGLTAYKLTQYYSIRPLVYIYDLAVRGPMQRLGIGKLLMKEINGYCSDQGMEEVFVQADTVDKHAVDFYTSTGGVAENVIHFYYPLNKK